MSVIPYLKYIREMSRKILMNKGFENVLYRTKSQNPFYSEYPPPPQDGYWRAVQERINTSQSSKRVKVKHMSCFLGIGLIVGRVVQKRRNRNVAGPLLYAPLELEQSEDLRTLNPVVLWEEITFNFDLLAILIGSDIDEEAEPTAPLKPLPRISFLSFFRFWL